MAFGRRMGPFSTGDLLELDVSYGALTGIYEGSEHLQYYHPQLLRRKVKPGEFGQKTGRGWYEHNPDGRRKEK